MHSENLESMQKEFLAIQNSLKNQIRCTDSFHMDKVRTVAGVDLAYWNTPDGRESAVCCIVVLDMQTHEVIEKQQFAGEIQVSYMPGFLAFRELPLVTEAAKMLEHEPDVYMFDGNGYLHPRHMGIASHASFYLHKPTIGVAKTYFRIQNTEYTEPDADAGSFTDIVIEGEVYGRALRTHANVKPVFLSVGNDISLDTATELTCRLTGKESHIPLPTRLADLETHIARNVLRGI